jgi:hypothetical protein
MLAIKGNTNYSMLKGMALALPALQTFNTLNSNLKFESERDAPLLSIECELDVLAGWHVASLERCSYIIILCCEKFMSSYS